MQGIGKFLVLAGLGIVALGLVLTFFDRIPFLGKLPGDISIKRENVHVYIPLTTSILLSVLVSIVFWLISFFKDGK